MCNVSKIGLRVSNGVPYSTLLYAGCTVKRHLITYKYLILIKFNFINLQGFYFVLESLYMHFITHITLDINLYRTIL